MKKKNLIWIIPILGLAIAIYALQDAVKYTVKPNDNITLHNPPTITTPKPKPLMKRVKQDSQYWQKRRQEEASHKPEKKETKEPPKLYYMGEQISTGYMSYVIDSAEWRDEIYRSYGNIHPDASFLVIHFQVRNDSNKARRIPPFYLVDENDKEYSTTSDSFYLDCDLDSLYQLNPEVSTGGCILFDIPRNHQYWLKISGGYWSLGYALVVIETTN